MHSINDDMERLRRSIEDVAYFANAFVRVTGPTGVNKIELNDFQKHVIDRYNKERNFFIPSERQAGKTVVAAIILLHQALYREYTTSLIVTPKMVHGAHMIELITEMYDYLPEYIASVKMSTRNKSKIEFENGASIIAVGPNVEQCRGRTITTIYIDESEWVPNLQDVYTYLLPTMASNNGAKIFELS